MDTSFDEPLEAGASLKKRPRKASKKQALPSLAAILRANPELDDEEGPRACLLPVPGADNALLATDGWVPGCAALRAMDAAADALCGRAITAETPAFTRTSAVVVPAAELQLYTVTPSAGLLAAALHAGFFCFASELRDLPVKGGPSGRKRQAAHRDRAVMNFELGGPAVEPNAETGAPGGRVILDLSRGSRDRLVVGKRSLKSVAKSVAVAAASSGAAASGSTGEGVGGARGGGGGDGCSGGFHYRLSVNESFYGSWAHLVAVHGVDWLGFTVVRDAYAQLHRLVPEPWAEPWAEHGAERDAERGGAAPASRAAAHPSFPRMVSIELWEESVGALATAEVGVLVGSAYTCLSLAADTKRCAMTTGEKCVRRTVKFASGCGLTFHEDEQVVQRSRHAAFGSALSVRWGRVINAVAPLCVCSGFHAATTFERRQPCYCCGAPACSCSMSGPQPGAGFLYQRVYIGAGSDVVCRVDTTSNM